MILRKNMQKRQLAPDDLSVLTLVSLQRAISLDHLPRFLALFEAQPSKERSAHRKSTAYNLVERLQHRGYIHPATVREKAVCLDLAHTHRSASMSNRNQRPYPLIGQRHGIRGPPLEAMERALQDAKRILNVIPNYSVTE